jgi:hypothetical protein
MASLASPHWHCVRPVLRDVLSEIGKHPLVSWSDVRTFFKQEARRIGQQWFEQ